MSDVVLKVLNELLACDTRNPPRAIGVDHSVFEVVRRNLTPAGFDFELTDNGNGCVSLLATRGTPGTLFNVHLDTVPEGEGWHHNPLALTVADGRAFGRGACDIKGAAAAMIAAAMGSDDPFAILFTSDEEGTGNCCVRNFCKSGNASLYEIVVVAEPTNCQAVLAHRGYLSVTGEFSGTAAHSSRFEQLAESAVHRAVVWASGALNRVRIFEQEKLDGRSVCFNIGRIEGGTKNNVISTNCRVTWSMRAPPGLGNDELLKLATGETGDQARWTTSFTGEPLPNGPTDIASAKRIVEDFCLEHNLPIGEAVDFWTEASIFSRFGIPAIVLGPGNIAQAHIADEWVTIEQLVRATGIYRKINCVER